MVVLSKNFVYPKSLICEHMFEVFLVFFCASSDGVTESWYSAGYQAWFSFTTVRYLLDKIKLYIQTKMCRDARKPVFQVSEQVPRKWVCAVTEDGWKLEISDLRRREIVLSM